MNKTMQAALRFLARREYSEQELKQRLLHSHPEDEVNAAVLACKTQHYLSDERFAASRIRHRISQGYGPRFIRQDLVSNGIDAELIDEYLSSDDDFWIEQVIHLLTAKYRKLLSADRMKAQRYLYQRGFSGSQIQLALKQVLTEIDI